LWLWFRVEPANSYGIMAVSVSRKLTRPDTGAWEYRVIDAISVQKYQNGLTETVDYSLVSM